MSKKKIPPKTLGQGNGKTYGIKTRLPFGLFIVKLFDEQVINHHADSVLADKLQTEFPNSAKDYTRYIRQYRNIYNRGEWSCQNGVAPSPIIGSWDERGSVVQQTRGPQPRFEKA